MCLCVQREDASVCGKGERGAREVRFFFDGDAFFFSDSSARAPLSSLFSLLFSTFIQLK